MGKAQSSKLAKQQMGRGYGRRRGLGRGKSWVSRGGPAFAHGRGFVFELRGNQRHVVDGEMIAALRARGAAIGRAFTQEEFDAWAEKPCGARTIGARLGNWRRALLMAGIEGGQRTNYTPRELIENLEAAWRLMGRAPSENTIGVYGTIGPGAYRRVWGGVRTAVELFVRYKRGEITRRELMRPRRDGRRKPLGAGVRWKILERDGHRCRACGRGSGEVKLEVDHVVPVCAGGTDEEGNLRVLCWECNRGRGGKSSKAANQQSSK